MNYNDGNEIYYIVAKNIKKYRKEKNMTQKELTEKTLYSVGFISNIESEKYLQTFSLGTVWVIANALDVSPSKLLYIERYKHNA